MQTTHFRSVSELLVARDAPNVDMSLILLAERLQGRSVNKTETKTSMQTTHLSLVSVVLVTRATPNADTSLIWL